jgi:hypothetical protein
LNIESLSLLKAPDIIARTSRDKPRELWSEKRQDDKLQNFQVSNYLAGDSKSFENAASFYQQTESFSKNSLNEKAGIAANKV